MHLFVFFFCHFQHFLYEFLLNNNEYDNVNYREDEASEFFFDNLYHICTDAIRPVR